MTISTIINNTPPSELAKVRGKRVETSTRDKARLLNKVQEIEAILNALGYFVEVKKSGPESRA